MNNPNEDDSAPSKPTEEEITQAVIEQSETVEREEEEENDKNLSSITTNNGATHSKGLFIENDTENRPRFENISLKPIKYDF